MANDSPAKSLVDIDLASLRVSAAEPSLCVCFFRCFAAFYFTLLDKTHVPQSEQREQVWTCSQMSLLVLKMTAEPQRGVASVWFSFVRDAFGM